MKLKTIFFLAFLIVYSYSQSDFKLGFKAGITIPNTTYENNLQFTNIEVSNKIGYNAGLTVNTFSAGLFCLTSELYYNMQFVNVKSSNVYSNIENNVDYKVEYIHYSLLPKYYFLKSSIKPYIFTGPNFAFYIADRPVSSTYTIPKGSLIEISENLKKVIFSVSIGAGIELETSKNISLLAELQFVPGLMNSYEETSVKAKTNSLEFKTGILIKL